MEDSGVLRLCRADSRAAPDVPWTRERPLRQRR
jgi:hypothetical protein